MILQAAIANAKTLEEVERLNQLLKTGQVPGSSTMNGKNPTMYCLIYILHSIVFKVHLCVLILL